MKPFFRCFVRDPSSTLEPQYKQKYLENLLSKFFIIPKQAILYNKLNKEKGEEENESENEID